MGQMTIKEIDNGGVEGRLKPDETKLFEVRCTTCDLPLFPGIGTIYPLIILKGQERLQCARLNATLHERRFGKNHQIVIEEKDRKKI